MAMLLAKTEEILIRKQDSLKYINNLKQVIQSNAEHEHLVDSYRYKRSLKKCHEENVRFLLNE